MVNARSGRCKDWDHEETMLLVNLKEESYLKHEEGEQAWVQIAEKLSNTPGISAKSSLQCRRRWDTLRKVYIRVRDYCVEAGKSDQHLDGAELMRSMKPKLATAYHEDWYNIVKRVCSQEGQNVERKNAPTTRKPSKRLKLDPTHPAPLPQPTGPGIGVLSVTSTSTSGPVIGPLYTYYEALTSVDRKNLTMSHVDTEMVKKLEIEIERLTRERQQQALTMSLEVQRLNWEKEDLERQMLQPQHGYNTRQIERMPYIRELSGDLIPDDMNFLMSPQQSSHAHRFGATIPGGAWTSLGNDGAEPGPDFSNMFLTTSTSASPLFALQTEEFNESLGAFDSIWGTQTPYIRELSGDLIPDDMNFLMSPQQSSHAHRFGATIPGGAWTSLGNDGAEPGPDFSNMFLTTSTSASPLFALQTEEFNESLGAFDSIWGTQTPYIRELSGDLIPDDMNFLMSPQQSSHAHRFGATIPGGAWTSLGNDGAEPGPDFSNMFLTTSTSASPLFALQTEEFNESLGAFDSIWGTQTPSSSASKPISGRRWHVLKLFVWACLHFSSSLVRIRRRNPSRTRSKRVLEGFSSRRFPVRILVLFPNSTGFQVGPSSIPRT